LEKRRVFETLKNIGRDSLKLYTILIFIAIHLFRFNNTNTLSAHDEQGKIKHQLEVSLDITEEAAKRIITHYAFQPKQRIDYVFDVYDGKKFLLFPGMHKVRFRVKEEEDKSVIQMNTSVEFLQRSCEKDLAITIREKKNGEMQLPRKKHKHLTQGNDFLTQLIASPQKGIRSLNEFNKTLQTLDIPLKNELEKTFSDKKWMYLPINITKKTKWKIKINLGYGEIIISISKGKDFIGNRYIQEKWEIEFQVDPEDWKDTNCIEKYCGVEKSVCKFLQTEKISQKDLNPTKLSTYEEVKKIIYPYNQDFGF